MRPSRRCAHPVNIDKLTSSCKSGLGRRWELAEEGSVQLDYQLRPPSIPLMGLHVLLCPCVLCLRANYSLLSDCDDDAFCCVTSYRQGADPDVGVCAHPHCGSPGRRRLRESRPSAQQIVQSAPLLIHGDVSEAARSRTALVCSAQRVSTNADVQHGFDYLCLPL